MSLARMFLNQLPQTITMEARRRHLGHLRGDCVPMADVDFLTELDQARIHLLSQIDAELEKRGIDPCLSQ